MVFVYYMLMGLALQTVRVGEPAPGQVCVRAFDGETATFVVFATAAVVSLAWLLSLPWAVIMSCLALGLFSVCGCRLEAAARPGTAILSRYLLFVIRWRRFEYRELAAWIDGWGDEIDPIMLCLGPPEAMARKDDGPLPLYLGLPVSDAEHRHAERLLEVVNGALAAHGLFNE